MKTAIAAASTPRHPFNAERLTIFRVVCGGFQNRGKDWKRLNIAQVSKVIEKRQISKN